MFLGCKRERVTKGRAEVCSDWKDLLWRMKSKQTRETKDEKSGSVEGLVKFSEHATGALYSAM